MNNCTNCVHMVLLGPSTIRRCRNPEMTRGRDARFAPSVTLARGVGALCGPHGDLHEALPAIPETNLLFRV